MSGQVGTLPSLQAHAAASRARLRRRKIGAFIGWSLCSLGFGLLALAMLWIIGMVLVRGITALNLTVFTEVRKAPAAVC